MANLIQSLNLYQNHSELFCLVKSQGHTKQIKRRIQSKKARRVPNKQSKGKNGGKNGKMS